MTTKVRELLELVAAGTCNHNQLTLWASRWKVKVQASGEYKDRLAQAAKSCVDSSPQIVTKGYIRPVDAVFTKAQKTFGELSWDWRARPTGGEWRRLYGLRVENGNAEGQFRNRKGLYWSTMDALSCIGGGNARHFSKERQHSGSCGSPYGSTCWCGN